MNENKRNSYIYVPVTFLLLFISLIIFRPFGLSYYNLGLYDITGKTNIFIYIYTAVSIILTSVCIYMGVKSKRTGVNYIFNRIMTIICLFLCIMSFLSFCIIRDSEEKLAQEMQNKIEELSKGNKKETIKMHGKGKSKLYNDMLNSTSNLSAELDMREEDKFYELEYYHIFTLFSLIYLFLSIFYFIHIKDKKINEMSKILREI